MLLKKKIREFIFPGGSRRKYFLRVLIVAVVSFFLFKYLCMPVFIKGNSMAPTYSDGTFNFCWRGAYWFSKPCRGDVVAIRFAGEKIMLLKRIVGLSGESVEFKKGKLFINGIMLDEPYQKERCGWELPPRKVEEGHVYVVGDNRSMSMDEHKFGQVSASRIAGRPLW